MELGQIFRVVIGFLMEDASVAQMVFHYIVTAADTGEDPDDILSSIVTSLKVGWDQMIARTTDLMLGDTAELSLYDPVLETFTGIATETITDWDGTSADNAIPNVNAALIKFFTSEARSQGRKYVPGTVETSISDNSWNAGTVANLIAMGLIWSSFVTSGSGTLKPGNFRATDGSFREWLISASAPTIASYQTRRKPGRGL